MARIALNCTCSWNFFIPGSTTGHEVTCPSCGESVRIPGRKPGRDVPMSPGAVAAEKQRRQWILRMVAGAIAATLIAGVTFAVVSRVPPAPMDVPPETSDRPGKTSNVKPATVVSPVVKPKVDRLATVAPLYSDEQIQEFEGEVFNKVWLINMSSVIAEIMRLNNLIEQYEQLQSNIATDESNIQEFIGKLAKVNRHPHLEPYFAQGDQIINFAQRDLTAMQPVDAAQILHTWANTWSSGAAMERADVKRGDKVVTITLTFPQNTTELLLLLRHPALMAAIPSTGLAPDQVSMPPKLLKQYQSRIDALPRGYLDFILTAERQRLKDLLNQKKGTSDEIDWFSKHVLEEILPSFEADAKSIRLKVSELEPKVKDNPAPDAVYMKDRRRLDGKIVEQTPEHVKLKSRLGTGTLLREEIDRIEKGKGMGMEFAERYDKSKGSVDKLLPDMAWCAEKNLTIEKQYVACQILLLDPSNEKARSASGLGRTAIPGTK
jgi:hypothetical protein